MQRYLPVGLLGTGHCVALLKNSGGHAQVGAGFKYRFRSADIEVLPVDLAQADAEVSPLRDQLLHHQYSFIQALRLTRQHFADHANGIGIEGGFCLDDGGKRGGVYRGSTLHSQGQEGAGGEHCRFLLVSSSKRRARCRFFGIFNQLLNGHFKKIIDQITSEL
ncbi:hypothetical protein PL963_P200001 (plasmid) [Pseudomonas cerasi]|uniref:Uncharacterized protein n=1 Tax=Pseudomonas cerasi TaxID=1583341 RepID=A0A2K4W2L1_9PSED|nr:hypothetical protein PL963_P200001 [Pseudomonas cerasi]